MLVSSSPLISLSPCTWLPATGTPEVSHLLWSCLPDTPPIFLLACLATLPLCLHSSLLLLSPPVCEPLQDRSFLSHHDYVKSDIWQILKAMILCAGLQVPLSPSDKSSVETETLSIFFTAIYHRPTCLAHKRGSVQVYCMNKLIFI